MDQAAQVGCLALDNIYKVLKLITQLPLAQVKGVERAK